ncbi:MAG TPA: hypothetical protein VND92_11510 [Vicinamibacterales bacterium]|nr:hypothetical protein [Vicinamibacterales bacterium]
MRRFDQLMRSSLWFRAVYVAFGFVVVFEIQELLLKLTGLDYTNPYSEALWFAMWFTWIWPVFGVSWRRLVLALATGVPIALWMEPHLSSRKQLIIVTVIAVALVIWRSTHAKVT